MTTFLRLLTEKDKAEALLEVCDRQRAGGSGQKGGDPRIFVVAPEAFDAVPGKPFAYWVSEAVRETFRRLPAFETGERTARLGGHSSNDERWLRLFWEIENCRSSESEWIPYAKGGVFSTFYADIYLMLNWDIERQTYFAFFGRIGRASIKPESVEHYLRPGLTWPRRTSSGLSLRVMPAGCIFADKGPAAFVGDDDPDTLLALLALTNSRAFGVLVSLQLAAADAAARSYEVGVIQKTPVPPLITDHASLATLARRAWSLKRSFDTVNETSHAFLLPAALRQAQGERLGVFDPPAIEAELNRIQANIVAIAFELYGFSEADREAVISDQWSVGSDEDGNSSDEDDEDTGHQPLTTDHFSLLSWAVGVAFGRFDWRLATGERAAPAEPEPFDPLPAKSPGMLPDGVAPFHAHAGILVDDPGHPHDLARLIEAVLIRVEAPVPDDIRRWLQRDFFAFHLQRYSKSRRKAPIYWPLSTASGSYTLWVYYPSLSNQTLFSAVNDFLDGPNGKLTHVSRECAELRMKGSGRSRDEENQYTTLQAFEQELTDLRDTLLKIAPTYPPNHDDGVQITAAPLWSLFRHKPWQKVLKDTWTKLEKGDYDWAHLALAYWPERVREKCKTDKSLAIAHGLEDLYVEPEAKPKKTRGRKKSES